MIDDVITKSPNEEFDDINVQDRTFWTCISRPEVDRDREFCPVSAFIEDLSIYKTNPVLLLHHIHKSLPVGKAIDYKSDNKGLYVKYQIAKTPLGDEVLQLISEKCLRGISAGFIPIRFKDNPNDYELPIQARGKNVKRLYERVELVEVSLLAIPSNRNSLVIHSEKGARLNDIVYKTYDIDLKEDISYVLKEWMQDVETKWFWSEDKHPRDENGQFTSSGSNEDIHTKLDKIAQSNKEMKDELDNIKSNQGLRGWAKKWAFRVGVLVGGYYFLKSQTGKKVLRAGKDATVNYAKNKFNESNVGENVKNLSEMVDHATKALKQMEKLNLDKTSEYRDLQKTLDVSKKALDNINKKVTKGFDDFISFGNYCNKNLSQFILRKDSSEDFTLKGFYNSHNDFLKVITKEPDFKEEEHPRDEDGKFRDKNSSSNESQTIQEKIKDKVFGGLNNTKNKIDNIKNNVAENTTYSADKFINWVKENKVKTGIIASVGIVSFPLISVALKSKGRLVNLIYSPNNRKLVPWEALAEHEKLEVFRHVEPGDVFAWGGYQHRSFLDMFTDVKDYLKDKSNWRAKDRVIDIMAKTVSNSPYAHTVMCVGKYDEKFAKTLFDKTKESKGHIPILKRFIETSGISDGKNRDRLLDALKTKNEKKFIRVSLKEWEGYPVLAGGTGGDKGIVNLSVTKSPVLGLESHAAIVKTNLDSKQREAIHQGVLKDYFKKTNLGIKLAITESPKNNIDILTHNIGDPVTSFTVKYVMGKKSDALLCGGVVAKLIKTYTGVELSNSKNIRYFTVKDLLKDKNFIKEVIEPRVGTRKKDTDIAKILATTAGVGTVAVAGHRFSKERTDKSFSNITTKEPDFKEEEHPRDEDGKFRDKDSAAVPSNTTTSNVKTTTNIQKHGGRRPNAGRLPVDAHNAVPIVMERIKKENPDWTHEQVKEEITRQAIERGKPDWDEYVNNPDEYMKKLKQEAEDIKRTTYNKTYVGKTKISGNVSSSEVAQIKSQIAISRSTFDKDVTLMGDIKETWDHYRSGRMKEDEVHLVKLGAAVASAAVLLGTIGYLRKAKFNKSGFHTYDLIEGKARQEIEHARTNRFKDTQEILLDKSKLKVDTPNVSSSINTTPGEGTLLSPPSTPKRAAPTKQKFKINEENMDLRLSHVGGMDNIGNVPLQNPTLYRIVEISTPTGLVAQTPAFDNRLNAFSGEFSSVMGKINVGLTSFMKRLKYSMTQKGENPIGKKYATVKGERFTSYRARFATGKMFHIDRCPLDENGVRRMVHLDIDREFHDLLTGIQVTKVDPATGKFVLNGIGIFNSKKMWENFLVGGKHIPGQPLKWKPNVDKLLDKMGLQKGEHSAEGAGMVVNIKDPVKFENTFNEIKSHTSEQKLLPRFLSAYRTESEMDTAAKKYKAVKGLEEFIETHVLPMTFSKTAASLVPFGTTSAIAYRIASTANVYNEAGADQRQREDQTNTAKEEVKSEQERLRRNRTMGNTKAEVNRLRRSEAMLKKSEADTKRKEAANVEARKIQQENAEAERAKKAQETIVKNQESIDQTG